MHIPDGYLSPATCATLYGISVPALAVASRRTAATLRSRQAPLLGLCAAFSFVVMMFNIPAPGGTSGHAVGAAAAAILLGPWGASVAIAIALAIQALFFGDGGITAYGANCLNMAIIMPFTAAACYRLLSGGTAASPRRCALAAGVAGFVSLAIGALAASVEFGIQPLVASAADGRPLYAPYPLSVAVPAMLIPHLLFFAPLEGVVTAMLVRHLATSDRGLLPEQSAFPLRRLVAWIGGLLLLSPLGLIIPALFGGGTAWGEWSCNELKAMLGFIPRGMRGLEGLWHAPLPDYTLPFTGEVGLPVMAAAYLVSAAAGILLILVAAFAVRRFAGLRAHER